LSGRVLAPEAEAGSAALAEREPQIPPHLLPELVIEPPRGLAQLDFRELWRYRELLYFLTWRDVKVRYKQTALGAAWAILQPVLTMVVFSLFFGRLAGLGEKTDLPYPIYVYAGLLPWQFFAGSVANCGASLVGSANLITKVYFPRLVIPLAAVGAALVDLGVAFLVLVGMMAWYGIALTPQLLLLPLCLLGAVLAAAGVGTLLAALTVAYRDFRYVVPFLVQIWMFVTPVIYPTSIVPERWRWLFALNPMAGIIDGFRAALLGAPVQPGPLALSLAVALALFGAGAAYFQKVEESFADVI
jgi:lipopolysaccharide transport system permease protein